jgi:hypothetical protein
MAKKKYYSDAARTKKYESLDMYGSLDSRRKLEFEDSRMIAEDHNAVANLPQNVIMRPFPKNDYPKYDLDDTIWGIDAQMDGDVSGARKFRSKNKY